VVVVGFQSAIGLEFVAEDRRARLDVFADTGLHFVLPAIADDEARTSPPRSTMPMTIALSLPPVPVMTLARRAVCMLRDLAPMKVSSTSTLLENFPPCFACIAKGMRWSMNHAVFRVTPSARASS
jgi:hypothetical protein